jgi:two-component system sensor histidine kinase TorS
MAEDPVLDLKKLSEIMGSDSAAEQKESLVLFLEAFAAVPADLAAAIDSGDAARVRQVAHAAKGTAAMAAAERLSRTMLAIETAARAGDWGAIRDKRGAVGLEFDEVKRAVDGL